MGVSCTKTWRQIKVHSSSGGRDRVMEESKRIFGEWGLSACIAQKSSYTSKFQLGGETFRCSALLSFCAGSTRCMRRDLSQQTTGHLHYDSHTHKDCSLFPMPKPFRVTTVVNLMLLQCSVSSIAIEFVPLKRIWNSNSTGLCWAAVIRMTATITLCVKLYKWHWLTVITMPNVTARFIVSVI